MEEEHGDGMSNLDWNYTMAGHDHGNVLEEYNCDACRKRHYGTFGAAPTDSNGVHYHDVYCEVCRQKWAHCGCD